MYNFSPSQADLFQTNKFIVIDNFLDNDSANECQREILNCESSVWDRYNNCFEQKYTYRDKYHFTPKVKNLFAQLTSPEFISQLNKLTNLKLINDVDRTFWGIHLFQDGDKLDIHVDAGRQVTTGLTKAVTFGLYLSYDWSEENNGCFEFWSGDNSYIENPKIYNCLEKIVPIFGRCIIFENNNTSWHGAPEACICKNKEKRIFLTCSYLMEGSNEAFKNEKKKALFIKRPQDPEDKEKDRLRTLRACPETCKDLYNMKKKILLFGSTGMLGRYVYQVLTDDADKYNVICINRADYDIRQDSWTKLNTIIKQLVANDVIINCAGIIPQKTDSSDYKSYIKVNSLFPHKLNEYAKERNIKFIHITTDCVFDGLKGNYNEQDKHTANTLYGISKSLGEPEEATVIRTSIIGEERYGKKSLIEWVISNKDREINGFTNHYWNGVTCLTLAEIIEKIIAENLFWKGVKHVFSPEVVTKYLLCKYISHIYGLNITIKPVNDSIQKNMTLCTNDEGESIMANIHQIYDQINMQEGV